MRDDALMLQDRVLSKCLSVMVSWSWVIGFVAICLVSYANAFRKKEMQKHILGQRCYDLIKERNCILAEQDELRLQINSQSDPLWIEMTLMKGLGLVPEGQKKILFDED